MPRKKITHNRADVRAMWSLMEKMGQEPVAVKFIADGTFRIMTMKYAEITKARPSPEVTDNEWDEVLNHDPS